MNFDSVGHEPGLLVWRIKDGLLMPVAKKNHGVFYNGDAYVVLNTKADLRAWDIHFWLGQFASKDEIETAVREAERLDQSLGGAPEQHREVQDHESALFLSYFKQGIRYELGGYESGFETVQELAAGWQPRLYRCKGRRNVRCTQVEMAVASLNLNDVFLLDLCLDIYVWMPPNSGRLERIRAMQRAKNIRDVERGSLPKIHVLDEEWKSSTEFWAHFGGKDAVNHISQQAGDDEEYWRDANQLLSLWKASDASGELKVTRVAQGEGVKRGLLDSNDAFILDTVDGGIYVWVGKNCTADERVRALLWGEKYQQQQNVPMWMPVSRVLDGEEPTGFTQWFSDWASAAKTGEFQPRLFQVSDASGRLVVEEVANYTQEDLDGDDVMIVDALNTVWVWVGAGATPNEKKQAQATAQKYIDEGKLPRLAGTKVEVIFQGDEPPTFKKFFDGWDDSLFKNQVRSVANMRRLLFS